MDDVVFEMELVKQVEVNMDCIPMLVARYHEGNWQRHHAPLKNAA